MKVKIDLTISENHIISTCQLYKYIIVTIPQCIQWICVPIICNVLRLVIILVLNSITEGGMVVWGVTGGKIGYNGAARVRKRYSYIIP
jgi:hypothetical protein